MLRRIQLVIILSVLAFSSAFADGTLIAILETVGDKKIEATSKRNITNKIRTEALDFFNKEKSNYKIMDKDLFKSRLPATESLEDCKDECAVDIGKKINVDYIVSSVVEKDVDYSLSIVVYDVSDGGIVGSAFLRQSSMSDFEKDIAEKSPILYEKIVRKPWSGVQVVGNGTNEFLNQKFLQKKVVRIESVPDGASLSIDDVVADCPETPCSITLEEGEHTFSFSLKLYAPQTKKETIKDNNQVVKVNLVPTFGKLKIAPKLTEGIGRIEDLEVTFDRKKKTKDEYESIIVPDFVKHKVSLKHKCYEPLDVMVGFNKGGQEHIIDEPMEVSQSILDLTVVNQNGEPIVVDVYANGEKKGQSPFKGYVPTCSKITVGPFQESVPTNLKRNSEDTNTYKYKGTGSFKDTRDYFSVTYNLVAIGSDIWFKENLKYQKGSDVCNNYRVPCHYSYSEALSACPEGYHMATKEDWNALMKDQNGFKMLALTYDGQYIYDLENAQYYSEGKGEYEYFWLENMGRIYLKPGESVKIDTLDEPDASNYRFPVRCVKDK
jgi:hypothetical protein